MPTLAWLCCTMRPECALGTTWPTAATRPRTFTLAAGGHRCWKIILWHRCAAERPPNAPQRPSLEVLVRGLTAAVRSGRSPPVPLRMVLWMCGHKESHSPEQGVRRGSSVIGGCPSASFELMRSSPELKMSRTACRDTVMRSRKENLQELDPLRGSSDSLLTETHTTLCGDGCGTVLVTMTSKKKRTCLR